MCQEVYGKQRKCNDNILFEATLTSPLPLTVLLVTCYYSSLVTSGAPSWSGAGHRGGRRLFSANQITALPSVDQSEAGEAHCVLRISWSDGPREERWSTLHKVACYHFSLVIQLENYDIIKILKVGISNCSLGRGEETTKRICWI